MRTAFVLAGGGSLGAVEVGMLQALVEAGVEPDLVAGASVGAINGAYFAGRPDAAGVEALAEIWRGIRRSDVFPFTPLGSILSFFSLRNYLIDPGPLRQLIERHLPYGDLGDAALPCHVVATDVLTGREVVLSSGPALPAILASAAIPAVFPPVEIGGRCLADGGIADHTPISAAVARGAERVIVLPTGVACRIHAAPDNSMTMALHALTLLVARQLIVDVERFAGRVKLRVVPPLCPVTATPLDFSQTAELIERAADSTRRWLAGGGLEGDALPGELRPHDHGPARA